MKKEYGITLVALVITIIILLILAGVTINALTENGILETAKSSTEKYKEKSAKEKLQTELSNLYIEKQTNKEYDSNEYLTKKLEDKGFLVNDDIIIVDQYKFEIDREKLEIKMSLGIGNKNDNIKIVGTRTIASDYNTGIITIEVEYEGEITSIKLQKEELEIPEKIDGKYTIEKEITSNGNYRIYVTDENNEYALYDINVTEISEDMEIKTAEAITTFRDRVNSGATYEGKTITLNQNIDLTNICYKVDGTTTNDISWVSIGTETNPFKGTFDGNNNTITGLYSNNNADYQGLFGKIDNGNVKNLKIQGIVGTSGKSFIGLLAGTTLGGKIENVDTLEGSTVVGTHYIGGIIGNTSSQISNCSNNAVVTGTGNCVRWNMWPNC